jgi:hypothetical protein
MPKAENKSAIYGEKSNAQVPPNQPTDNTVKNQSATGRFQIKVTTDKPDSETITATGDSIRFRTDGTGRATQVKTENSNIARTPVGITYRVQIAAATKKVDPKKEYPRLTELIERYGVYELEEGGYFKYMVGNVSTYGEADRIRTELTAAGCRGCFIKVINNQ